MNSHFKETLLEIFQAGVTAVDPFRCVTESLKYEDGWLRATRPTDRGGWELDCRTLDRLFITGCGKGAVPMTAALAEILGSRITRGIITTKDGHSNDRTLPGIVIYESSHPVPDSRGMAAAGESLSILQQAGENDLVVAVISGGGSALWPLPAEGITLAEKQQTTDLLLRSGADIAEMNCLRKHLSRLKGGHAALATSAHLLVLVLSDVIGDYLDVIASGPFFPDRTTFSDAAAIIDKYNLALKLPASVRNHIAKGMRGSIPETPKPGSACFERTAHLICGSNALALDGCAARAHSLGWEPHILSSTVQGAVTEAAEWFCNQAIEARSSGSGKQICLISGGETTVDLGGSHGKGGRNQEFAACAGKMLSGRSGIYLMSCGTDGTDGPTDAAGAVADGQTVLRAASAEIDYERVMRDHNSYILFDTIGDLVKIGPTGTNVMDVQIALVSPNP